MVGAASVSIVSTSQNDFHFSPSHVTIAVGDSVIAGDENVHAEIAATLDLPLGTVKTYIHRARNELRLSLAHLKE